MRYMKGIPVLSHFLLGVFAIVALFSAPANAGWLPETRLTAAPDASYLSANNARCMVTDLSGNIHLVWYDHRDGDADIYYNRFDGVTWGAEIPLTSNATASEDPAIAVDPSGHPHVVWVNLVGGFPEICYRAFDGVSWSAAQVLTEGSGSSERPSVAVDALGHVHVVWRDYRDGAWGVFYKMFDGITWSEDLRLTDPAGYPSHASVVADDSLHLHVVWDDYRHFNWEIFYKQFDGVAWGPDLRLTNDPGLSENPMNIVDTYGNIHVFWDDNRAGQFAIHHKVFDGVTWGADEAPVVHVGDAVAPSAAAGDSGRLHLVWYDNPSGQTEIFYADFDGASWSEGTQISNASQASENPMVAVDDHGYPHVVWHDKRDGNFEIYWRYRRIIAAPEIVSVDPDSGVSYTVVHIDDLAGIGFFSFAEVWLQMAGETNVEASQVIVESASKITCDFNLDGVTPGSWDIVVGNIDGQRDTLAAGFRVNPLPKPQVISIDPNFGVAYEAVHITDLAGGNFDVRAEAWLRKAGEDSILPSNLVVQSPTSITCDFDLGSVASDFWDVVVRNPDGRMDTLASGFEVRPGIWDDDLRLTHDGEVSSTSSPNARCITADDSGRLHLVWYDNRDGNKEIYYKKHNGTTWGPDERLTDAAGASANPSIATGPNAHLHVVWSDYRDNDFEVYYKEHDGTSWGTDQRLTNSTGDSKHPSIAVGQDNRIYVVWQDDRSGPSKIYFKMYDGSMWTPDECIAPDIASSGTPAVAVDGFNHVHVIWYQDGGEPYRHLFYQMFDGTTWSTTQTLASVGRIYGPTIAVDDSNRIHVAWHHERRGINQGYDIFYRHFNGMTWEPEVRITDTRPNSHCASVAAGDSGDVHIVWADKRDTNNEIYYTTFDGDAWGPAVRLTRASNESKHSFLAVGPEGAIHVVWRDLRDGTYEIYYKRRDPGSLAGGFYPEVSPATLLSVAPNPVYASALIEFQVESSAVTQVSIYDIAGRLVWKTDPEHRNPGLHRISWGGTDARGGPVAPGIYFLRLQTGPSHTSKKIIVLR